ncbi:hypothetical protein LXL04_004108 [Taraxacum kok-saghyz]
MVNVGAEMISPRVMAEGRSRMPKALKHLDPTSGIRAKVAGGDCWGRNAQSPRDGRGPQSNTESAQGCCKLSAWILQVVSEPKSRVRFSQGAISEGGIVGAEMLSPRVMAEGRSRMPKALKVAAG